jgi:hypothetical protein
MLERIECIRSHIELVVQTVLITINWNTPLIVTEYIVEAHLQARCTTTEHRFRRYGIPFIGQNCPCKPTAPPAAAERKRVTVESVTVAKGGHKSHMARVRAAL